jgi:hypothetical protein
MVYVKFLIRFPHKRLAKLSETQFICLTQFMPPWHAA